MLCQGEGATGCEVSCGIQSGGRGRGKGLQSVPSRGNAVARDPGCQQQGPIGSALCEPPGDKAWRGSQPSHGESAISTAPLPQPHFGVAWGRGDPSLLGAQPRQEQWLHQAAQITPCSSNLVLSSHFAFPQLLYDSGIPFPSTKKNGRQNCTKICTLVFIAALFIKAEMSTNDQQVNVQASCNGYLQWHTT